jgi:hypothetical protein
MTVMPPVYDVVPMAPVGGVVIIGDEVADVVLEVPPCSEIGNTTAVEVAVVFPFVVRPKPYISTRYTAAPTSTRDTRIMRSRRVP